MSKALGDEALFGAVQMLKVKGDAASVSVLVNALELSLEEERYDNWNGGLYNITAVLKIDYQTYAQLSATELDRLKTAIGEVLQAVLELTENDTFVGIALRPWGTPTEGWREEAVAWVRGEGVNNQGRVRSDSIATREHDGLLFRSNAEINLYKALKMKGITFAPLPVFIRGGASYYRLEPDFLIIRDGCVFQVEVDGDTFHQETPVAAQARVKPMEFEGVRVRRLSSSDVDTLEKAKRVVDGLIRWIDKEKKNR